MLDWVDMLILAPVGIALVLFVVVITVGYRAGFRRFRMSERTGELLFGLLVVIPLLIWLIRRAL